MIAATPVAVSPAERNPKELLASVIGEMFERIEDRSALKARVLSLIAGMHTRVETAEAAMQQSRTLVRQQGEQIRQLQEELAAVRKGRDTLLATHQETLSYAETLETELKVAQEASGIDQLQLTLHQAQMEIARLRQAGEAADATEGAVEALQNRLLEATSAWQDLGY